MKRLKKRGGLLTQVKQGKRRLRQPRQRKSQKNLLLTIKIEREVILLPPFFSMAIGQSRLHKMFRRGRILSEAVAWFDAFTPRTKRELLDLIREDQLRSQGIDGDGDVVGYYSFATELISGGEKPEGTPYTFYDKGDFFRSMYIKVFRTRFTVVADGQKEEDNLFDKYGDELIKYTNESMDQIKRILRQSYIDYVRKILFES